MRINKFRLLVALVAFCCKSVLADNPEKVYFTTGCKVGEVRDRSAIIWTRLCGSEKPNPITHERKKARLRTPLNFDDNQPVEKMDGAVKGVEGEVRIILTTGKKTKASKWHKASGEEDFTVHIPIERLKPYTQYQVTLEGRVSKGNPITTETLTFRTAPRKNQVTPVFLTSSSCQYFWDHDDKERGFKIYDCMNALNPDFYVQTGDYIYYDKPGPVAENLEKARHKWHANNSWPGMVDFYKETPVYIEKDDHDMLRNDAYPEIDPLGSLSFQDGLKVWYEEVPIKDKPYRTFRWGKDLQIWLVEGREFRTSNPEPDEPDKTIWAKEQKDWFVKTVNASDATFKILFSPTPVVGPDREKGKNDNHANKAFETEGRWLRKFLASQGNMYVVNGDRHWQYVSIDDETGLMEFSQGPASNSHAGGWKKGNKRPEHCFLRVNGGFIAVKVERVNKVPTIKFIHYDVEGNVVHEEVIEGKL